MTVQTMRFANRQQAGQRLAERLGAYHGRRDTLVLAVPRGGIPVAAEVARELRLPMDVLPVQKLVLPGQADLAIGAVACGGARVLNRYLAREFDVDDTALDLATTRAWHELERQEVEYGHRQTFPEVSGHRVILVDDGVVTGATMHAALRSLVGRGVARIILAVAVADSDTLQQFKSVAHEVYCLATPFCVNAVDDWYVDFSLLQNPESPDFLGIRG